jgi:hypothetical protein
MKNLWLIAIGSLLMAGCIENNSSNASDGEEKEVVSDYLLTISHLYFLVYLNCFLLRKSLIKYLSTPPLQ